MNELIRNWARFFRIDNHPATIRLNLPTALSLLANTTGLFLFMLAGVNSISPFPIHFGDDRECNLMPKRRKADMQIKVMVIDKVSETFDTKKGSKTLHLLVCQDQARPPLRNSFDYEMTADEVAKYGANIVDKQVELNVRDISQGFTSRIRMQGAILKVA